MRSNPRSPCPCCGHVTLETPGSYDLCPVCFWEDDPEQLAFPLSHDGANGISLLQAQSVYQRLGAIDDAFLEKVRKPRADEPRDPDWRPIDLDRDDVPRSGDEIGPWPEDCARLFWWRSTYYRAPGAAPVPQAPRAQDLDDPSPEVRLMARVLDDAPEARVIEDRLRTKWEVPAPFVFCAELPDLVLGAHASGDEDLVRRLLEALNTGLTDNDANAYNCVAIGFLEDERWHAAHLDDFIATWPRELHKAITRQRKHAAKHSRGHGSFAMFRIRLRALLGRDRFIG